jgi:hypothetical protein
VAKHNVTFLTFCFYTPPRLLVIQLVVLEQGFSHFTTFNYDYGTARCDTMQSDERLSETLLPAYQTIRRHPNTLSRVYCDYRQGLD